MPIGGWGDSGKSFSSRYVFNIKGNNYRLVVVIVFIGELLTVRFIGTHSQYDKIDCKTI